MADFTVRDMQTGELIEISAKAFEARDPNVWVLVTPAEEIPPHLGGEPTDAWKNADIETYALERGIDLAGATKKDDMLAAIADHPAGE